MSVRLIYSTCLLIYYCIDYRKAIRGKRTSSKYVWQHESEVNIINGYLFKRDANFVVNFKYDEVPGINTFIGPYPQSEADIESLSKDKVTDLFCVQSYNDFKHRDINFDSIKQLCESYNIDVYHVPIIDFDLDDLVKHITKAVKLYANLVEQKDRKVFVHCTAGMSRSVSVVVGYL
jgi:protein tyrosine phosphatase (PTP) superfamily phosphohydrolase (DUF442 family)